MKKIIEIINRIEESREKDANVSYGFLSKRLISAKVSIESLASNLDYLSKFPGGSGINTEKYKKLSKSASKVKSELDVIYNEFYKDRGKFK